MLKTSSQPDQKAAYCMFATSGSISFSTILMMKLAMMIKATLHTTKGCM